MSRKWLTLTAVCTGVFMLLLDVTIVNVALPDIQSQFRTDLTSLQWVIDAYALTLAALLLTAGTLADIVGRKRVFIAGIAVFTVGSLACGLAPTVDALIAARAAQGVGGAIMFATSLALLAQAFPPRERGTAFGVFGAVTGIAVAVGPVLGGALTSGLSWHWVFFVNLPVGIATLAVAALGIDESKSPGDHRIDWFGCLLFSAALGLLVFGLIRSHPAGWTSAQVIGSLTAAGLLLVAFAVVESVVAEPMVDASLFRVPTFTGGLIAAWAISASMFSMITYIVIYMQNTMGYSALQTGLYFLPFSGLVFVAAAIAGRLSDRVPARWLIAPGFVFVAAGLLLMRGTIPNDGWTQFLLGFVVAGIGTGFINVPLASTAVGVVEQSRAGMASGMNSTFRQIGIATGVAILGSVLSARLSSSITNSLSRTSMSSRGQEIGDVIARGDIGQTLGSVPQQLRGVVVEISGVAYANALDLILIIAATIAGVAAVSSLLLVRRKDFVDEIADGEVIPLHRAQPAIQDVEPA